MAAASLKAFLDEVSAQEGGLDATRLFHAVRRLSYLSTGDRTMESVLARRAGSCSGKHILLAALLREIGVPASVVLVDGDFATPLRGARNIPPAFEEAAREGVPDIHNVVEAVIGGRTVLLDATWHDAVKPYGFRVNDAWAAGQGDTQIAVDVRHILGARGDPAAAKAALIGEWPQAVQARRRRFLESVNSWVAAIEEDRAA